MRSTRICGSSAGTSSTEQSPSSEQKYANLLNSFPPCVLISYSKRSMSPHDVRLCSTRQNRRGIHCAKLLAAPERELAPSCNQRNSSLSSLQRSKPRQVLTWTRTWCRCLCSNRHIS